MSEPEPDRGFSEPWEAKTLAVALSLQEAGAITVAEWSTALGAAIKRAQTTSDPEQWSTYYFHVLDALETLMRENNLVSAGELSVRKARWKEAYLGTPHGKPVTLKDGVRIHQMANGD